MWAAFRVLHPNIEASDGRYRREDDGWAVLAFGIHVQFVQSPHGYAYPDTVLDRM